MKQAFINAQQIDTVAAYERILQQCQQKRWWKPRRIIRQAQLARDLVFERYKNRIGLLQKVNSLAANHAKQHNQQNAKDIARYNGFFDVLRYALIQRQLQSNSHLPIDVRLNKDWFVWTNNTLTATPKISDTERLTLNSLQATWHANVTDQISLDALRDNYVVNGRSFSTLVKELIKAASSERVNDSARDFTTYVQHYLVSNNISAKTTADVGNSLVTQYFIFQLFAALNADSKAASYQRVFEEHLPDMLAQIFSLFFPDETLHSTGKPLFSKPQRDSDAACVLNIDLFPTSRRFNGTPSVKGVVYVNFYDETLWSKEATPAANDNAAKISQDAIARLDATGLVGAAIMPPLTKLKPSQQKAIAATPSRLEPLLKELDDAAKELVRSHTEDIALELLAELLDDKENSLITQFDAVVQSGIEENYALVLQAAAELAGFGLGMLGGDD
ncbi:hypothetical protein [Rheinheimera maricola]|uniref:DUF935 family protein n=1 Tax=Rheinheimera maricola TaxID=2793282 RepID=A0ABS7X7X5_9GAMM|nr:hypothetical protein [Rheinheimera maricola]MBZ9611650.1 hypothetical protein [Rheinheimera maricola]